MMRCASSKSSGGRICELLSWSSFWQQPRGGSTRKNPFTLWIIFQMDGLLDSGEPIALRGSIYVLGEEADLTTLPLGADPGTFFLIADLPENSVWVSGLLTTTASGNFVPADDPLTMQIEGTSAFTFKGQLLEASDELTEQLPWDPTSWPLEYHEVLLALLLSVKADEEADEEVN